MKTIKNTINAIEVNTNINLTAAILAVTATGLTYLLVQVLFSQ
jgi:hypothetical protein